MKQIFIIILLLSTTLLFSETIVVTNNRDNNDNGSLRFAINKSNATNGNDSIIFLTVPNTVLTLLSELPILSDDNIIINGFKSYFTIDGSNLLGTGKGIITIRGNNTIINGLVLKNYTGEGIKITSDNNIITNTTIFSVSSGIHISGNNNTIENNIIHTNKVGISIMTSYNKNTHNINTIYDNDVGIYFNDGSTQLNISKPTLLFISKEDSVLHGYASPNNPIFLYSDNGNQGQNYIGKYIANDNGSIKIKLDMELYIIKNFKNLTIIHDSINSSQFSLPIEIKPIEYCTKANVSIANISNGNMLLCDTSTSININHNRLKNNETGIWNNINITSDVIDLTNKPTQIIWTINSDNELFNECSTSDTINITYKTCEVDVVDNIKQYSDSSNHECPDITVYNIITPNGDQTHEYLEIDIYNCHNIIKVNIYNKWQNIIRSFDEYDNNIIDKRWNGMFHNTSKYVPDGTYYYTIQYEDSNNNTKIKSGLIEVRL